MALPTNVAPPQAGYPNFLGLFGQAGVGKSCLSAGLNTKNSRCLVLDMQGGYGHIGGLVINIPEKAIVEKTSLYAAFLNTLREIREEKSKGNSYDFIWIDPLSSLTELYVYRAAQLYNMDTSGKSAAAKKAVEVYGQGYNPSQLAACYSKNPVTELGQNGYRWHDSAWKEMYAAMTGLASKCLIIAGHTKLKVSKMSELTELSVQDIDFRPTYTSNMVRDMSDSGLVKRVNNQVIVDFKFKNEYECFKSRYFDGKEIVLSEKKEDGTIETHWERIFPFLLTNKEN